MANFDKDRFLFAESFKKFKQTLGDKIFNFAQNFENLNMQKRLWEPLLKVKTAVKKGSYLKKRPFSW